MLSLIWLRFCDPFLYCQVMIAICNINKIILVLFVSSCWHRDCLLDECNEKSNHTHKEVNHAAISKKAMAEKDAPDNDRKAVSQGI